MNNRLSTWTLLLVLLCLQGCSTTITSVDKHGGNVYALPVAVVDQMLKDAMATEKLAEGIRKFAIDQVALETLLEERMN